MLKDFKAFALRGNVIDLAVGVIIGAAFGAIVKSLVDDVIMPLLGSAIGKVDFSNLFVVLGDIPVGTGRNLAALKAAGVPVLAYGNFMTLTVNFLIIAFAVFVAIRQLNRLQKPADVTPVPPVSEEILLLREIRDGLKK